jgi:hypothetical protein
MSDTPSILQDRLASMVFAFDDPVRKEAVRHLAREVGSVERELAAVTQERDSLRDDLAAARYALKIDGATEGELAAQLADARRQGDVIKQECVALRRAMAEMHDGLEKVHLKYQHLDWLRQKKNLDPWHECVRDFMRAVGVAIGYEPKAAQAKEGGEQ